MNRDPETYLSDAEVRRVTRRTYKKAQAKRLAKMGWPFQLDGDDWPLVLRAVHDELMGMKPAAKRRRPRLDGLSRVQSPTRGPA